MPVRPLHQEGHSVSQSAPVQQGQQGHTQKTANAEYKHHRQISPAVLHQAATAATPTARRVLPEASS